jgi:hypothetical protein
MKRAALYMRVSTLDQHPETQLYDLHEMAKQRGYLIVEEYTDMISGAARTRSTIKLRSGCSLICGLRNNPPGSLEVRNPQADQQDNRGTRAQKTSARGAFTGSKVGC